MCFTAYTSLMVYNIESDQGCDNYTLSLHMSYTYPLTRIDITLGLSNPIRLFLTVLRVTRPDLHSVMWSFSPAFSTPAPENTGFTETPMRIQVRNLRVFKM